MSGPLEAYMGGGREDAQGAWFALVTREARSWQTKRIPLDFFPHGVAVDPQDPQRVVVFEKHGPGCQELDLRRLRAARRVTTTAERQFYGHGVFVERGKWLLCTETRVSDGVGFIAVRDGATLREVGTFPSYGHAPHDLSLTADRRTLLVTNGGGQGQDQAPNVAVIDVESRELKERVLFDSARINAGHVVTTSAGDLAVVSAPRAGLDLSAPDVHGQISFRRGMSLGPLRHAVSDVVSKMRGETLSVAVHESTGVVAATNPEGNLLTFWDLLSGKLMHASTAFPGPRGLCVTPDGQNFALTWGPKTRLTLISPTTFEPLAGGTLQRSWISGSHLYSGRLT